MADAAPAPKEGEIQIDVKQLNSGDFGAGQALTALFAEPEDQIQPEGEGPEDEAGAPETAPTSDTEDGQSEQEETPAIEPPVSWNAEAKEEFAKLPLSQQKFISDRERERDDFIATHGRKTAEETQRLTAKQTQLETERAQHANLFAATILQLVPDLQRFNGIDWDKLALDKPAEWAQQRQAFESLTNRMNNAQAQLDNIRRTQAQEQEVKHKEFLEKEKASLFQKIPEFSDPSKGKALYEDMSKHLTEFTSQEIAGVVDHRFLVVAKDALSWRKHQAALKAAGAKKTQGTQSNVRPLRPAARQPGAADDAQVKHVEALHGKLAKSGTIRDAQELLVATGMFGKP